MNADPQPAPGAVERGGAPRANGRQLSAVDLTPGGTVAVTRPSMPRILRFLLAMTGVRV
jgi:hypothetical protein